MAGANTQRSKDGENEDRPFDLAAFDLDGTLLSRDLTITASTIESLQRLREAGARLVVATGRRFETAREHAARLGFAGEEPVICYGGSMVRRMDGETLLYRTIASDLAPEVLGWAEERGIHTRVLTDGEILLTSEKTERPTALERLRSKGEPGVREVGDLVAWLGDSEAAPIRIVFVDRPDRVEGWLAEAQDAFSGRAFVTRSLPHYVEVGSLDGTKSRALEFLCKEWGIDHARTLAFGDADNDADMLRFAGFGVAVGGANGEIRNAADALAPSVEEDGVARFLEELLDGRGTVASA